MLAIAACRDAAREPATHEPPPVALAAPHDALVDAAQVDAARPPECTGSYQCGPLPEGPTDCEHSCEDGRCVLLVTVRKAGEVCGGDIDGPWYQRKTGSASATRLGFCDVAAGLYCDHGQCARRKPAGSRCSAIDAQDGFECATGLYCDDNSQKCMAAPGIGGECGLSVFHRCAASAFCDDKTMRCVASRADGKGCGEGAECRSHYCDPETLRCAKQPHERPCPP